MLTIPSSNILSSDAADNLSILSCTLDSVYWLCSWFTCNHLSVNSSKTEHMSIGNSQQRSKLTSSSLTFCGNNLIPVDSCLNLSIALDSDSFKIHRPISSICSSSFCHIRQFRQIRSSLDTNSAIIRGATRAPSSSPNNWWILWCLQIRWVFLGGGGHRLNVLVAWKIFARSARDFPYKHQFHIYYPNNLISNHKFCDKWVALIRN